MNGRCTRFNQYMANGDPDLKNRETGEVTAGKLQKTEIPPALKEGEVLVEVAGCGVCHTDLGYFYDGVPTVNKPPLTLGHEISGTVVAGDAAWIGKRGHNTCRYAVQAVHPLQDGQGQQVPRPENARQQPRHLRRFFQPHTRTIDRPLPGRPKDGYKLEQLSVIADAVTTPYQASKRANLQFGDNAIVIGATGGVGVYMAQTVKALGRGPSSA